ncbi:MAG: hypothetical protein GW778_08395 [Alphaproteobacteria bacterium]|nr:hypothetical protein [Alphaproteobacteria bacterium]
MNINNRTLWSSLKVRGTTVSVSRAPRSPYTVLKVASLIDTGRNSQTIVLENAFPGMREEDPALIKIAQDISQSRMAIPPRIANLNCVFTGRRPRLVHNAQLALKEQAGKQKLIPVIPEIVAPGDYVIFRHLPNRACFKLAGMMRSVSPAKMINTGKL